MNLETVQEIQSRIGGMSHYQTVAINATELFELCEVARKALFAEARPEAAHIVHDELCVAHIQDAERYRWLNGKFDMLLELGNVKITGHGRYERVRLKCGEALDRWIDQHIEAERSEPQGHRS
jgi:hypothetical protein